MTATASVGLIAIFMVDFANLFYISLLGKQELAAAIGYAGTVLFFSISISIGITIAATALVSRAIGAGDHKKAIVLSGSSLIFIFGFCSLVALCFFPFIGDAVRLLGAEGQTGEIATEFLQIVIPSMPLMGLSICTSGLLRSIGDANRAMYVTLGSGIAAAILDPVFIFTLDLGVLGAAYVTVIARIVSVVLGFYGLIKIHNMVALPSIQEFLHDAREILGIAVPAVLTNIATPVGNAYVTASIAPYGDDAVAGWAIIGRLIPVAFGFIFALSGAIGPIIGQNYGAGQFERVKLSIINSLMVTAVYTLIVWLIVFLLRDIIITGFNATDGAAELVAFFINIIIVTFLFTSMMFVANAAFNNLGYATYSTGLNWGRATVGTIPFVWVGAKFYGAHGVLAGWGLGAVVFGLISLLVCRHVINQIGDSKPKGPLPPVLWRAALSAFSSGKGANLQ